MKWMRREKANSAHLQRRVTTDPGSVSCPLRDASTLRAKQKGVYINAQNEVRFRGQTGKHLLTSRLTGFDPTETLADKFAVIHNRRRP